MNKLLIIIKISLVVLVVFIQACVYQNIQKNTAYIDPVSSAININDIAIDSSAIDYITYHIKYKLKAQEYELEWFYIKKKQKANRNIFILFNIADKPFVKETLLTHWLVKVFIPIYDLILINIPGNGQSQDIGFAYDKTVSYVVLDNVFSKMDINIVEGMWAYGISSLYAVFGAYKIPTLKYLILGGGYYDLEKIYNTTTNKNFKSDINKYYPNNFTKYFESNSISWDFNSLSQNLNIIMYHGDQDTVANFSQAQEFKDNLSLSGYFVKLDKIENMGHNIPSTAHANILCNIFLNKLKVSKFNK